MKTVLITGASSGIGKQMAFEFAKHGFNLILVARRTELLEKLKDELLQKHDIDIHYFSCDIAIDYIAVYNYCKENNLKVDVLVNNAGYGDYGKFSDADLDKNLNMIELNNKALVALSYYFIKDMKENGYGHIINVGSVASFVPGPYMAVYYATKAFVMSFSMAIREELKADNINVSVLCPAPTKSPFWDVAGGDTSNSYNNVFARMPSDAANTAYHIYEHNKAYEIDGLSYKFLFGVVRHLPIELCARAVSYIQAKTKVKKN